MLPFKETFENSILVTAKTYFVNQKHPETRRCLILRDKPNFLDLVQTMEKLFGGNSNSITLKLCIGSFYYIEPSGERVMFSSDEELAIAIHLTDKELKIGMEELQPLDSMSLKVENPSIDSSSTSIEPFHSQNSTPSQDSHHQADGDRPCRGTNHHYHRYRHPHNNNTTSTPTLFKTKIVPKLSSRWSSDSSGSCIKSKTFTKRGANFTVSSFKDNIMKKRKGCGAKSNLINSECCYQVVDDVIANTNTNINSKGDVDDAVTTCLDENSRRDRWLQIVRLMLNKVWPWLFPMVVKSYSTEV